MTNIYDKTVRKWIHKFNDCGIACLFTKVDYSNTVKINDKARKEIRHISSISPRALGLKFSTWSLRSIAGYMKEKKIVKEKDGISHTTVEIY
jgi:transposase